MNAVAWAQRGIERLSPEDRPALAAFQAAMFGADAIQSVPEHHRWLYDEAPTHDPQGAQFWICKREGVIVGQQGGIPFRMKAGDRSLRASWSVDLMVAPEWRLRGVGPAIAEIHSSANEVVVSVSMSDPAYKAYKRAGWFDLGVVPTWVRVIDPAPCLAATDKGGPALRLAAAAAKPALALASMGYAAAARLGGVRLVEVPAFDERVDELWAEASAQHPVLAERTSAYLKWRFDAIPGASRKRRFYVMRRGSLVGYFVLRADRWRGLSMGTVLDYMAKPGYLGPTFALAVERARKDGAAALLCRTLNARAVRPFKAMGFVCFANGLNTPTRMMARPAPEAADADVNALLADPVNWFVTSADSDIGIKPLSE